MRPFVTGGPPRYQHQVRGLRKMIDTGGVAGLLFDPGAGKSACVVDYAGLLALKSPVGEARILVICPLVAVDTWVEHVRKFISPQVNWWAEAIGGSLLQRAEALAARGGQPYLKRLAKEPEKRVPTVFKAGVDPRAQHWDKSWAWDARGGPEGLDEVEHRRGPAGLGADRPRAVFEILNIDTFSQRTAFGRQTMADVILDAVRRFDPDIVVVDESHKIKSWNGNASRLLGRIAKHVNRRAILTGTVMPRSPLDVSGQWRFLEPYAFGKKLPDGSVRQATLADFQNRFVVMGGYLGREIKSFKNLDELQDIMAKNSVAVRKKDALDLPPTTDAEVLVELSAAEKKAYNEMKNQLATQLANGQLVSSPNRLVQMLRLRQITSGHLPDDRGVTQIIGTSKADTIRSLVHDTLVGEKRIVIFALFTKEIELLTARLAERGTEIQVISGATPKEERVRLRKRFGSDDPQRMVMIAQIKTMSLAVNELVTASHAIFASLSQQRDDYVQARDRLDRIGQTLPCTFWHVVVPASVDTVILKSHRDRTALEAAILDYIKNANPL